MRAGKSPGKRGWSKVGSVCPPEPEEETGFFCKLDPVSFSQVTSHLLPKMAGSA